MAADKKWIFFAVFIVLLFTTFIAGNKYWFYPEYTAQIIPGPAYSSPVDAARGEIIKPFEGTLKKILEKSDESDEAGDEETDRNPFIYGDRHVAEEPEQKPEKVIKSVEVPNLGLIITGDEKKIAMLDGNIVREGDLYGDHVVEKIEPKHVDLSGVYGKLRLRMPSSSFRKPEVVIIEESVANVLFELVYKETEKRDRR